VGRELERSLLQGFLELAVRGQGCAVVIDGEPGVGKTRLAEEIALDASRRQVLTAVGNSYETGQCAYLPFVEILDAILAEPPNSKAGRDSEGEQCAELPRVLADLRGFRVPARSAPNLTLEESRHRLFDSVVEVIGRCARHRALLLIFDDLHWADVPTLLLLEHLLRQVLKLPILVIATYRSTELNETGPFTRTLDQILRRRLAYPLSLKRLSPAGVEAMLRALSSREPPPELARLFYKETDGNPFFIEEVFRHLANEGKLFGSDGDFRRGADISDLDVPHGVRLTIERRLSRLSETTREVLRLGAVAGRDFSLSLLKSIADVADLTIELAVEEAERAHLIAGFSDEGFGQIGFVHELVRQTLLTGLSSPERQRLHLRIAIAIEALHSANPDAHSAALAHHYRMAGPSVAQKAIEYAIRAGEMASAVFAYQEASSQWMAALKMMDEHGADPRIHAHLLERVGSLALITDPNNPNTTEYLIEALQLYDSLGERDAVAELHVRLGIRLSFFYRSPRRNLPSALDHYEQAEALLAQRPVGRWLGLTCFGMGTALAHALRAEDSLRWLRRAIEISEHLSSEVVSICARSVSGMMLCRRGRLSEGITLTDRAYQDAQRLSRHIEGAIPASPPYGREAEAESYGRFMCDSLSWQRVFLRFALMDLREVSDWLLLESSKSRFQARSYRRFIGAMLHEALSLNGEMAKAHKIASECEAPPSALVDFLEGEWDRASGFLHSRRESARNSGFLDEVAGHTYLLARVRGMLGDQVEAERLLNEALALTTTEKNSDLLKEIRIRATLAILAADRDDLACASAQLDCCRAVMAEGENWFGLAGLVARAEGVVNAANGMMMQARDEFQKSSRIFDCYRLPYEQAETLYHWGRALMCAGDHDGALEKLDSAAHIYRSKDVGNRWLEWVVAAKLQGASRRSGDRERTESKPVRHGVFRKEGDYWAIGWRGKIFRLKSCRGVNHIAMLLERPGQNLPALEIMSSATTLPQARSSFVEAIVDPRARADYKRRLEELDDEIETARTLNDLGRVTRILDEIEVLQRELGRRGVSSRLGASAVDRARQSVTKAIKYSIRAIAAHDAALGRHLQQDIRTGSLCCYAPDPAALISWEL